MRVNRTKALLGFGAAFFMLGVAQAASDEHGATVTMLRVSHSDTATITFNKTPSGAPVCATYDNGSTLAVDISTNSGREWFKLATAAFLAGKTVRFVGSGTCTVHPTKEDLASLYMPG